MKIKKIKKNRETLVLNKYFSTLECELSPSICIIKYILDGITIIGIYTDLKVIRVRYYLLPINVKDSEYLDEYIKIYTTFVDYKIVEW